MCLAELGIVFHWPRFLFSQTGSTRSHTTLQRTQPQCYLNLASPWLKVVMSTGQFVLLCLPHINNVQNADVTAEVGLRPKWMKNKTKQNLYKFIREKVARKWRTTAVTELNHHQISLLIESFHDKKKIGAGYICTCCDQLWYRSSVSLCSKTSYNKCSKDIVDCRTCVTGVNSIDSKEWICKTCDKSWNVVNYQVFPMHINNVPWKTTVFKFESLEERIIIVCKLLLLTIITNYY